MRALFSALALAAGVLSASAADIVVLKRDYPACNDAAMRSYIEAQRAGNFQIMAALLGGSSPDAPCTVLKSGESIAVLFGPPKNPLPYIETKANKRWTAHPAVLPEKQKEWDGIAMLPPGDWTSPTEAKPEAKPEPPPVKASPVTLSAAQIKQVKLGVSRVLLDPYSAKFGEFKAADVDEGIIVCGVVNSKNRMGAYAGAKPFGGHLSKDGNFVVVGMGGPDDKDTLDATPVCKLVGIDVTALDPVSADELGLN